MLFLCNKHGELINLTTRYLMAKKKSVSFKKAASHMSLKSFQQRTFVYCRGKWQILLSDRKSLLNLHEVPSRKG